MVDPASRWGEANSVSEICSVLADERCRQVVRYLRSADAAVATVEEIAEHAVAPEDPSTDRERTVVRLHHLTLPRLDDAGVLEYDPRQGNVRYAGHDALESVLDRVRIDEPSVD